MKMVKVILLPKLEKECNLCNKPFETYDEDKKFCDWNCYINWRNKDSTSQFNYDDKYEEKSRVRFWDNVEIKDENSCWEWQGYKIPDGYGQFCYKGKDVLAHRFSYELCKTNISEDNYICHTCDNKSCVNPNHLWQGTNRENQLDAYKKGLVDPSKNSAKGENHPKSKVTADEVREMRNRYENGEPPTLIAEDYPVTDNTVSGIVNYKTWRHIE